MDDDVVIYPEIVQLTSRESFNRAQIRRTRRRGNTGPTRKLGFIHHEPFPSLALRARVDQFPSLALRARVERRNRWGKSALTHRHDPVISLAETDRVSRSRERRV